MKGEGGNILIGNKMEIIYSSNPHYPVDFHPTGTNGLLISHPSLPSALTILYSL